MSKRLILCLSLLVMSLTLTPTVFARTRTAPTPTPPNVFPLIATQSATASTDAQLASPSAAVEKTIQEKNDKDITQVSGKTKDHLMEVLDQHPMGQLSVFNFLQKAIRRAISNGLPANIIVLLLLFPVIASLIAFSRHVIGLKGFGVYTPAVLSVAFVSTGIVNGILLFAIILITAIVMKKILSKLHLQYLPRTAMLLWGVSIIMLVVLIGVSFIQLNSLLAISIFPVLIVMLLAENFMESQLASSQSEAIYLTVETLLTAIICSVFIGSDVVQQTVILHPELTLFIVAVINLVVGRYSGLRFLEWIRFRSIID